MNKHKWAKEIIAFANGEKVEIWSRSAAKWYLVKDIGVFDDFRSDFRIAPKEQYGVIFVVATRQPFISSFIGNTIEDAKAYADAYRASNPPVTTFQIFKIVGV